MRQTTTQLSQQSYTLTITDALLAGETITAVQGGTLTINGSAPTLPHLLVVGEVLTFTHTAGPAALSGITLLSQVAADAPAGTLPDPDPAQWSWVDTFDRTFLGTDYTVDVNTSSVQIENAVLIVGEAIDQHTTQGSNNPLPHARARLNASLWNQRAACVQYDGWFEMFSGTPLEPFLGVRLVGATKNLSWNGTALTWGIGTASATLATAQGTGAGVSMDTPRRVRLTVDETAGRIQVLAGTVGLVDVALPADWLTAMGNGAQVELFHESTGNLGSGVSYTRGKFDNFSVRSGNGMANGGTGTGGTNTTPAIGALWRFGAGAPDDGVGTDGDIYMDTSSGALYQRVSGAYQAAGNLRGPAGSPGVAGVGIQSAALNGSGHLIFTRTDGSTLDAGVLPTPEGTPGTPGVGIQSVTIDSNGHLIFTRTDNTTFDAGAIPTAAGTPGLGVQAAAINGSGHLILTRTDGSTLDAGALPGGSGGGSLSVRPLGGNGVTATTLEVVNGTVLDQGGGTVRLILPTGGGSAPADPTLIRDAAAPARTFDFSTFTSGNVDGQNGWTASSSGTIASGKLAVSNHYDTTPLGVKLPGHFYEGEILLELDPTAPQILLRMNRGSSRSFGAWIFSVNAYGSAFGVDAGIVTDSTVVHSDGSDRGVTGITIPAEPLMMRVTVERNVIRVWVWPKSQTMPTNPTITTVDLSSYIGADQTSGAVYLSRTYQSGGDPGVTRLNRVSLHDDAAQPTAVQTQAAFIGRWWPAYRAGTPGMATITQGSEVLVRVTGSDLVAQVYRDPATSQAPRFAVSVNGAAATIIPVPQGSGWGAVTLATGLADVSDVSVILDGFHELDPVWNGAALLIGNLTSTGGTTVPIIYTDQPIVEIRGDSITAGVLARASAGGTSAANSAGSLTYGRLAAKAAGMRLIQAGYGGTGLNAARTGSGGVPGLLANMLSFWALHPDHAATHPEVDVAVVNIGTNDSNAGVAGAAFQTDYGTLLTQELARFPNAKILAMRPFNGAYATDIQAAVSASGSSRVQYVDTTGWVTTYTDGTHPGLGSGGHPAAAGHLAPLLIAAIGGSAYVPAVYTPPEAPAFGIVVETADGTTSGTVNTLQLPNGTLSIAGGVGTYTPAAGGGSTSSGTLTRSATNQANTILETFDTDLVAADTFTSVTGFQASVSGNLSYDAANKRILSGASSGSAFFWAYKHLSLAAHLDYSVDMTLLGDYSGLQHGGLWVQGVANTGSGYRVAFINAGTPKWIVSRYVNGVEDTSSGQLNVSANAGAAWSIGTTKRLRITVDYTTGAGVLYVDGVQTLTWTDTTFTGGIPGGFSYGSQSAYDNLSYTAVVAAQVNGLSGGLRAVSNGVSSGSGLVTLAGPAHVDVADANGLVLASAIMQAGDVWTYAASEGSSSGSFPMVASSDALPNGGAAILDDDVNPPRLIRKRANGVVWYGPTFSNTP
ncbi:GDSL-type esterase/lipase family protein [Deinococcus ruber]|uniref:SGNH hydrolase-type esterase domain-containing protein n=1 Tax=Deinococcus ruber TaxID=1848197 RepID=A0A918C946_9DEIO|nr:GDSL-type esterase/lipase family protein [Deinococcus ruber]GGR11349.1 hypothetical protein GCM10008957_25100 [Deinococcus ruber]